jgi:hypothetical protein
MRPHFSVRRPSPLVATALVLATAAARPAAAQGGIPATIPAARDSTDWKPRGTFAFYFTVAEPKAEFAKYVDDGWGFAGHGVLNMGSSGAFGIRLDGGWLRYGTETISVSDPVFGGRLRYDLTTANDIAYFGVGPQLQIPSRYLRPYAYAVGGFAYFSTTSTLKDLDNADLARDTNYDDWTSQWAAGGGVAVPLWRGRGSDASLDVGGRYHFNGQVRYLREGGIQDQPDGSTQLEVLDSKVHLITWHIGLSFAIR